MTYNETFTAALANQRLQDRLREAEQARRISDLPRRARHRTPRRRVPWWGRSTAPASA